MIKVKANPAEFRGENRVDETQFRNALADQLALELGGPVVLDVTADVDGMTVEGEPGFSGDLETVAAGVLATVANHRAAWVPVSKRPRPTNPPNID